jgi:hypothetical protein
MTDEREAWLDRLFAACRNTFGDMDASPEFIPSIWARIDEERRLGWVWPMRQWATRLVGAAVTAIFILAAVLSLSNGNTSVDIREASYVDALTADSFDEGEGNVLLISETSR